MKKNYLAEKISKYRESVNWSQAELARRSRVTSAAISQIEAGYRCPSIPVLQKLAKALKCPLESLVADPKDIHNKNEPWISVFYRKFSILDSLTPCDQQLILQLAERLQQKD